MKEVTREQVEALLREVWKDQELHGAPDVVVVGGAYLMGGLTPSPESIKAMNLAWEQLLERMDKEDDGA
jgi:hypothetical protein